MVVLGKVADAYGLRGWLRVHPFGDDPVSWGSMPHWWMREACDGSAWKRVDVRQLRVQGEAVVVSLRGIDDRNAAEAHKGWLIGAPREALPATADDEYYWADLIGLEVVNQDQARLGCVAGLIETGANAVLQVVDQDGNERLLPFVDSVVREVDSGARRIRVDWGGDW